MHVAANRFLLASVQLLFTTQIRKKEKKMESIWTIKISTSHPLKYLPEIHITNLNKNLDGRSFDISLRLNKRKKKKYFTLAPHPVFFRNISALGRGNSCSHLSSYVGISQLITCMSLKGWRFRCFFLFFIFFLFCVFVYLIRCPFPLLLLFIFYLFLVSFFFFFVLYDNFLISFSKTYFLYSLL